MSIQLTDIDNTLQLRDILSAIPEQMITEIISFINPDVAQTYTEILRLNETMPNEQRCVLATADGSSDNGFAKAYKEYNPNVAYVIDPNWHDLCQITALKKVCKLMYTPTEDFRKPVWEGFSAKHTLETVSNEGVFTSNPIHGCYETLTPIFKEYTMYVTRTNSVLSFILSGFNYEWRERVYVRLCYAAPYFFYIMAKRKTIFRKHIIEYQYNNGIITDRRFPLKINVPHESLDVYDSDDQITFAEI